MQHPPWPPLLRRIGQSEESHHGRAKGGRHVHGTGVVRDHDVGGFDQCTKGGEGEGAGRGHDLTTGPGFDVRQDRVDQGSFFVRAGEHHARAQVPHQGVDDLDILLPGIGAGRHAAPGMDNDQRAPVADEIGDLLASTVRDAQDEPVVPRPHADGTDQVETSFHLVHHPLGMAVSRREQRAGSVDRGGQAQGDAGQVAQVGCWQRALAERGEDHRRVIAAGTELRDRCISRAGSRGRRLQGSIQGAL